MVIRFLVVFVFFHVSFSAAARVIPDGFHSVANKENIPVKILYALALNESQVKTNYGRVIAWAFTLNYNKKGYHFRTHQELKQKVEKLISQGYTSFDVGIAQVNYRWHKDEFKSLDEMIDPLSNLSYAAKYLKSFYTKHGGWWLAVGRYHSPYNKSNAAKYTKRVRNIWLTL
jgi:soluble lytic murein transglycosylase-like protein